MIYLATTHAKSSDVIIDGFRRCQHCADVVLHRVILLPAGASHGGQGNCYLKTRIILHCVLDTYFPHLCLFVKTRFSHAPEWRPYKMITNYLNSKKKSHDTVKTNVLFWQKMIPLETYSLIEPHRHNLNITREKIQRIMMHCYGTLRTLSISLSVGIAGGQ